MNTMTSTRIGMAVAAEKMATMGIPITDNHRLPPRAGTTTTATISRTVLTATIILTNRRLS